MNYILYCFSHTSRKRGNSQWTEDMSSRFLLPVEAQTHHPTCFRLHPKEACIDGRVKKNFFSLSKFPYYII